MGKSMAIVGVTFLLIAYVFFAIGIMEGKVPEDRAVVFWLFGTPMWLFMIIITYVSGRQL